MSHPIETLVLPRLDRVVKSHRRAGVESAWRADCPACGASGRPLSIAIAVSGAGLVQCHGGNCAGSGLPALQALGLGWSDLYPKTEKHFQRGNGGPANWMPAVAASDALLQAHCGLLGLVCQHLPQDVMVEAMEAILMCGEAAGALKNAARRAMRGEGKK